MKITPPPIHKTRSPKLNPTWTLISPLLKRKEREKIAVVWRTGAREKTIAVAWRTDSPQEVAAAIDGKRKPNVKWKLHDPWVCSRNDKGLRLWGWVETSYMLGGWKCWPTILWMWKISCKFWQSKLGFLFILVWKISLTMFVIFLGFLFRFMGGGCAHIFIGMMGKAMYVIGRLFLG